MADCANQPEAVKEQQGSASGASNSVSMLPHDVPGPGAKTLAQDQIDADADASVVVAALYKFTALDDYEAMREPLHEFCVENDIKGTLLLAKEGINGTVSGTRESIDALLARLKSDPRLADLEHKESYHVAKPFLRTKIRLKKEIVTLGVEGVDPTKDVGTYVEPKEWNKLITDPEVMVIDTRNTYEVELGTFQNALDPMTQKFRDFPQFCDNVLQNKPKNQKIAMFCTGGIRCEKSTSFLKQKGFENVYHLKGGILKYLEEVPKEESQWKGKCYVFDDRIAVDHSLTPAAELDTCIGCRHVLVPEDKESADFVQGVQCPHCADKLTPRHLQRVKSRALQIELHNKRKSAKLESN
eukprot:CAMPEP_0184525374 /NCGR_PEP_ID=MMETSP0198_2-20121128/10061_1 /TAXON_ID=1112570 /ORGANISM="Thraustochytrium sp., Strain LLF1b" /LENGTH=354 /DNA_ID=CAMNT_0026916823 /DNA_START=197 /DNA_END=1261 /DNA_ORIENTATION=-